MTLCSSVNVCSVQKMLSFISRQDHPWSRRCSTETVFSIQGRETDYVRDTSDTEAVLSDSDVEYEPVTAAEEEAPVDGDTSEESDNNIIETKVIAVTVDDGELHFADSEESDSKESDSEIDLYDFWLCIRCRNRNNNPMYSYCQKCFKMRKSFFPARPKRKIKRKKIDKLEELPRTYSQDSGVHSSGSQELHDQVTDDFPDLGSQDLADFDFGIDEVKDLPVLDAEDLQDLRNVGEGSSKSDTTDIDCHKMKRKRPGSSIEAKTKRSRLSQTGSDTDFDDEVKKVSPLIKSISDPAVTIEANDVKITKKMVANTLKQKLEGVDLCVVCVAEPKSGVFVHGRIAHICCCYKCAVKVWAKARRCPVCNCKVSNVLKAVVM